MATKKAKAPIKSGHVERSRTTAKKAATGTNTDKKELAQLLYTRNDLNQKEVAARVGVTEKTLGNWIKDGLWNDLKKSLLTTKDEQLRHFYDQLSELNTAIKERDPGSRYADSKEADTLVKISAAIRNMETETNVGQIIEVAREFLNWMQADDLELAKTVTRLFDGFVKDKLKRK